MYPSTQKITNAVYSEVRRLIADNKMVSFLQLFLIGLYEPNAMRPENTS